MGTSHLPAVPEAVDLEEADEITEEAKEEDRPRARRLEEASSDGKEAQGHQDARHARGSGTMPEMRSVQPVHQAVQRATWIQVKGEDRSGKRTPGSQDETRQWQGKWPSIWRCW